MSPYIFLATSLNIVAWSILFRSARASMKASSFPLWSPPWTDCALSDSGETPRLHVGSVTCCHAVHSRKFKLLRKSHLMTIEVASDVLDFSISWQTVLNLKARVLIYCAINSPPHDQDMTLDCHAHVGLRDAQLNLILISHSSFHSHIFSPYIRGAFPGPPDDMFASRCT